MRAKAWVGALELAEASGDVSAQFLCHANLGNMSMWLSDRATALYYFERALAIAMRIGVFTPDGPPPHNATLRHALTTVLLGAAEAHDSPDARHACARVVEQWQTHRTAPPCAGSRASTVSKGERSGSGGSGSGGDGVGGEDSAACDQLREVRPKRGRCAGGSDADGALDPTTLKKERLNPPEVNVGAPRYAVETLRGLRPSFDGTITPLFEVVSEKRFTRHRGRKRR